MSKSYYSENVKKTVIINSAQKKVWEELSNIIGLSSWVMDVSNTVFLSKIKRGVGAVRKITFNDGNTIEEHIVGWRDSEYLSYIAVNGLPLRAYHATLSIERMNLKSVCVTWQSFFNSENMNGKEFSEFVVFLKSFYEESLKKLRTNLEK